MHASTTYDAANRPTTGANPTATYSSDDDGRLTARPGYQYAWDDLGRLTSVKNGSGATLVTYTYDPLDRLRMADYGSAVRIRFRYVGLTASAAQWIDDASGTVTRSIGNGWLGERLVDWTGSGSSLRFYGTNSHHDVTWLASSTGTVSASLRYDPWGTPRTAVPTGYSPFRFQGSWFDDISALSWVVTRWYAPSLGRFISEDTLLGKPVDPPSRHLYAYAEGDPVSGWDPDGRMTFWEWVRWFQAPHNTVVLAVSVELSFIRRFFGGHVYAALPGLGLRIPGGGPRGGAGLPDLAWKRGSTVWLWEVKHDTEFGRTTGRAQLMRYIAALRLQGRTGLRGFPLIGWTLPVLGRPGLRVSWRFGTGQDAGLVLYRTSWAPPMPVPVRNKVPETVPKPVEVPAIVPVLGVTAVGGVAVWWALKIFSPVCGPLVLACAVAF